MFTCIPLVNVLVPYYPHVLINSIVTKVATSFILKWVYVLHVYLEPIYTGLVTTVQVLYLLEICCLGLIFIILYDEV